MKRYKVKLKQKKLLMFKDEKRRKRYKRMNRFINLFFVISLFILIMLAILFIGATVIWPIFWILTVIITLGLVLLRFNQIPNIDPFLQWLTPILVRALIICAVLFLLKVLIKWYFMISEIHALKKNKDENLHYIAVAKATIKSEITNFIVLVSIFLAISFLTIIAQHYSLEDNTGWQDKLPLIIFMIIIIFIIIGKRFKKKLFLDVDEDVMTILNQGSRRN